MSKYVLDSAAAKAISAYVILDSRGAYVAKVVMHHGQSRCLVNVWQTGAAATRSAVAAGPAPRSAVDGERAFIFQHATAKGYGYDKRTAALAGLYIDGHALTDHCSRDGAPARPRGLDHYPADFKFPKGYSPANPTGAGWRDCYRGSGLEYLEAIGYHVVQAL